MPAALQPLPDQQHWLLLVHQLPARPAYFRVKIWRRLQAIGAVAVKPSVYTLPFNDDRQEDFEWLAKEIVAGGGEALVYEARLIDGLSDAETRGLFDRARDEDYAEIFEQLSPLLTPDNAALDGRTPQIARLRKRFERVAATDFFGANGRARTEGLLRRIEARMRDVPDNGDMEMKPLDLSGKIWVTRRGVFVDRLACAWAIKRFVDPEATFKFVDAKGYRPAEGEVRFDMFEGEITHEGDKCSLEVLIERADLGGDAALGAIAKIVHDIDLKDDKFGREETQGIALLLKGVCTPDRPDEQRIARASAIFSDLYASFGRS